MEQLINDKLFIAAAKRANDIFDYGSTIKKEWLMKQFLIEEPEISTKIIYSKLAFEFMQNMEGFRNLMLNEHKKHLVNVRGDGYLVVLPKNQTVEAIDKMKREVGKELNRAMCILQNVNENLLSNDEILRKDAEVGKVAAISVFTKKRLRS